MDDSLTKKLVFIILLINMVAVVAIGILLKSGNFELYQILAIFFVSSLCIWFLMLLFFRLFFKGILLRIMSKFEILISNFIMGNFSYSDDWLNKNSDFKRNIESLKKFLDQLKEDNGNLVSKYKEKTAEFEQRNRDLTNAYQKLQETQMELLNSKKMASLGQLVAGLCHELNNPINWIYGSISCFKTYIDNIKELVNFLEIKLPDDESITIKKKELEYSYIIEDIDSLLFSIKKGAERIKEIVKYLRSFSRLDEAEYKQVDIYEGIETTLHLLQYKLKDKITIKKDFCELPLLHCYPGQLNQVFMNVLMNSIEAIEGNGLIDIKTEVENNELLITFKDDGKGISDKDLEKIYDPFFSTKMNNDGYGLGLSISYRIMEKHGGNISVYSKVKEGTKVILKLPIK